MTKKISLDDYEIQQTLGTGSSRNNLRFLRESQTHEK